MPHRRQESSEWIDAAIKRAYRQPKPELKRLARELDREVGWLKWRAGVLGVRRVAEQPWRRWTEAEIDLLRDGIEQGLRAQHAASAVASGRFSAVAIRGRGSGRGIATRLESPWYSASEVGKMLGIASKSVAQWIEKGWLKADRGVGIASEACADDLETRRLQYQITMPAVRKVPHSASARLGSSPRPYRGVAGFAGRRGARVEFRRVRGKPAMARVATRRMSDYDLPVAVLAATGASNRKLGRASAIHRRFFVRCPLLMAGDAGRRVRKGLAVCPSSRFATLHRPPPSL